VKIDVLLQRLQSRLELRVLGPSKLLLRRDVLFGLLEDLELSVKVLEFGLQTLHIV
jgi:hypothetical protein